MPPSGQASTAGARAGTSSSAGRNDGVSAAAECVMMQKMTDPSEVDLPLTEELEAAALEILEGDDRDRRAALDALIARLEADEGSSSKARPRLLCGSGGSRG